MIKDITADILEEAVKRILMPIDEVLIVNDGIDVPDDFMGIIVQVRHRENTITSNDGKIPLVSVYEMEIVRKRYGDVSALRSENSGATLAILLSNLQISVNEILEEGLSLHIINVALTQEEVATNDARVCLITNNFDVMCQPLIIEEV